MKAFVVGFPKSGTNTLHQAFERSGMASAHWKVPTGHVGEIMYRNVEAGDDPFAGLETYQAVTQADVCIPAAGLNFWPNLDFAMLALIRRRHPQCLFILNYRDPAAIADSMGRWNNMAERFAAADIPGLPRGQGGTREERIAWIENHHARLRDAFSNDAWSLELDMAAEDAGDRLGARLGVPIAWWGKAPAGRLHAAGSA